MIQLQKKWLADLPWEKLEAIHRDLCLARQLATETNPADLEKARKLWETNVNSDQTLHQALELCRRCLAAKPFAFMNATTFTAAARRLLEPGLGQLPPVEAQIMRTTISHYVAGQVPKRELEQVLKHFENAWKHATTVGRVAAPQLPISPGQVTRPVA